MLFRSHDRPIVAHGSDKPLGGPIHVRDQAGFMQMTESWIAERIDGTGAGDAARSEDAVDKAAGGGRGSRLTVPPAPSLSQSTHEHQPYKAAGHLTTPGTGVAARYAGSPRRASRISLEANRILPFAPEPIAVILCRLARDRRNL